MDKRKKSDSCYGTCSPLAKILVMKNQKTTNEEPKNFRNHAVLRDALSRLNEIQFDENCIHELSDNLDRLTLKYKDSAGRLHTLWITLSCQDDVFHVSHCHVDLPDDAIKSFPVPIKGIASRKGSDNGSGGDVDMQESRIFLPGSESIFPFPFAASLSLFPIPAKKKRPPPKKTIDLELVACYREFCSAIDNLQNFMNELDDLDRNCCILEPDILLSTSRCGSAHRKIQVTESVSLLITLNLSSPRCSPDKYQFISENDEKSRLMFEKRLKEKLESCLWRDCKSVRQNLECCLEIQLPSIHPRKRANTTEDSSNCSIAMDQEMEDGLECGVCYTYKLVGDDNDGTIPSISCENYLCSRVYHASCLQEWLESLSSSRITFDVILGECPYCQEPISVTMRTP